MRINHIHLNNNNMSEIGKNLFRKQILKVGKWVHPNNPNDIMEITSDLIRQIIKNFKAGVLDKVPVPDTHTNSALANTGYVVGLEEVEDGLDAIIKFESDEVAEKARKRLIPGTSASFTTNYLKKDTGEYVGAVLLHVALVDNPYLKGMRDFEPLSLGEEDGEHIPYIELKEDPQKEEEILTLEEMLKVLKEEHKIDVVALQDSVKNLESELTTQKQVVESVAKVFDGKVELADNTLADVVKQVIADKEKAEGKVTELNEKVAGLEKDILTRDAKSAVAELVRDGRITAKDVEKFEQFYLADKTMFESITSALEPRIDFGEKGLVLGKKAGEGAIDTEAELERITKELNL